MSHPYKLDLGAKEIPRDEWAVIYSQCKVEPQVQFQEIERVNAKTILTGGDYKASIIIK